MGGREKSPSRESVKEIPPANESVYIDFAKRAINVRAFETGPVHENDESTLHAVMMTHAV